MTVYGVLCVVSRIFAMADEKYILIVEDNRFLAKLLENRFSSEGFRVTVCYDGTQCLKSIDAEIPSMVLLDILLPGSLDGIEVLRRLRGAKATKNLPVVVFTNVEKKDTAGIVTSLGAQYLVKAYSDTHDVVDAIREALGGGGGNQTSTSPRTRSEGDAAAFSRASGMTAVRLKEQIEGGLRSDKDIAIIGLVDDLLRYAFLMRASDIHMSPEGKALEVRIRIDGIMHSAFSLPRDIHSEVITRVKVLSGLRTDEHQMAQDGRFRGCVGKGFVDVRVSIAPTYYGENCVMRLLAQQSEGFMLETLGFSPNNLRRIYRAIQRPYGMILTTGPTGSGKTTTLYSTLRKLNTEAVSIITIEDPIEYSLEGIDQIQVNTKSGLTFAHGLRFILRQDPDIIMVGEIRDDETASIAVNAAMTGHLLLSTLHTNNAATAFPRLIDMKVEPFLISSTVNVIISQRLVRTLCVDCKRKKELTAAEAKTLLEFVPKRVLGDHRTFCIGKGCTVCGQTGYKGRMGIHEVLSVTDAIREHIAARSSAIQIEEAAIAEGMVTILEDGVTKAMEGLTSIEEVLRVFREWDG